MKCRAMLSATLLVLIAGSGWCGDILPLAGDWRLQSSAKLTERGKSLSQPGVDTAGWHATSVPRTVLAALVDDGTYPDPYYGLNMKSIPGFKEGRWMRMPEGSPFHDPWWYRTEFSAPAEFAGKTLTLHLDGINYQANVWLNGKKIGDSKKVKGMFQRFEFDVTDSCAPAKPTASP